MNTLRRRGRAAARLFCCAILLLAGGCARPTFFASLSAQKAHKIPRPACPTEVVGFEDNFLFGEPAEGSLLYRKEGAGLARREPGQPHGRLLIDNQNGAIGVVHPAQYDRPTLKLRLTIESGEPSIAFAHNGLADRAGRANESPGLELVLRKKNSVVRDLKTGRAICVIPEAVERGREQSLAIHWDMDARRGRVDLPRGSYEFALPATVTAPGGFGLRAPEKPGTKWSVSQAQVVWQDARPVVFYDGLDTVFDLSGRKLGALPPARLPAEIKHYSTRAVDLRRGRALLVMSRTHTNPEEPETMNMWAVRELATGKLRLFGETINGCIPFQGGGGMDGFGLFQRWVVPSSTCWVDWNAYERGDMANFVKPHKTGTGRKEGEFVGFHDPTNALDGSLARYIRIDNSYRGVQMLTVHPNLERFAPFAGDPPQPGPTHPLVSHTGSSGVPMQMAARDRERAWYEQWAYLANGQHVQNRGFNLFSRQDDWATPMLPLEKTAAAFDDYANVVPSLTAPGELYGRVYRFFPMPQGAKTPELKGFYHLRMGAGKFGIIKEMPRLHGEGVAVVENAFQILIDPAWLKRD